MTPETKSYDVVICGGGLAGLALARQISLKKRGWTVLVLEKQAGPLPDSAFKVGESTIESGAYYYAQTIQLEDYLETEHLEKLGLRYFYGGGATPLARRPEFGVRKFLPAKSYQLDRGLLEEHLRDLIKESDLEFVEGADVKSIELADEGAPHTVHYQAGGEETSVSARWVVDAMGRRRCLQRQLGLMKENEGAFNSAWFRVKGKVTEDDWVDDSEVSYHSRVDDPRWQSTTHFMGAGYWVWLIPLSPGNTSVGIVASDALHPVDGYRTYEKAMEWLKRHEPLVAEKLRDFELMDFKVLKDYSYTSHQMFSKNRWVCVGESGVFADPYYSVGSNMIAFANGFAEELIRRDLDGQLDAEYVDHCNHVFLTLNDALTDTIHRSYHFHDNAQVMAFKTIWDYYIGWTTTDPQLYHEVFLDPKRSKAMSGLLSHVIVAQARMLKLFDDWATHPQHYTFEFIDYIEDLPTLTRLFVKNLPPKNTDFRSLTQRLREAVNYVEDLAQFIFQFAVNDVYPEKTAQFGERPWVNIGAISLHPDQWEADGLFEPRTQARDISYLEKEIGGLFRRIDNAVAGASTVPEAVGSGNVTC